MRQALRVAAANPVGYERRWPEETTLYRVVQEHFETFLAEVEARGAASLPQFVKDEFDAFLERGILVHGFLRLRCTKCGHEKLVAFSCKRRGICPSCGARRMAETAAWLVEHLIPKVPVRQWVLSFPTPLRSLFAVHPELLAPVLRIIHRVIATHLIRQAGVKRSEAATGAASLIQRFALTPMDIHLHGLVLDGVYHTGCAAEQRSDLEHLCRYITRPAIANEGLSVNYAGQVVLKLKTPYRDGTNHLVMSPLEFMQRLAALMPRPRLHLIRFHGVLAPHAKLRVAIVPIPAQTAHVADCEHAHSASARMSWARLLKRVFDFDVERCGCGGKLKIIAAIEEPAVIERILTHLGLCAQPPPRAPARRFDLFQAA